MIKMKREKKKIKKENGITWLILERILISHNVYYLRVDVFF